MIPPKRLLGGALAAALFVLLLAGGPARALPINGDRTIGILTSFDALGAVGVTVSGTNVQEDTILGDVALFDVTGGELGANPFLLELEHEDQNLVLSRTGLTVTLEDLVIRLVIGSNDKLTGVMSANVTIDADGTISSKGDIPVFSLELCEDAFSGTGPECEDADGSTLVNGLRMTLTDFWDDEVDIDLPSDQFGVALLDISVVPEPSTLTLAGLGILGLAIAGRRRRR